MFASVDEMDGRRTTSPRVAACAVALSLVAGCGGGGRANSTPPGDGSSVASSSGSGGWSSGASTTSGAAGSGARGAGTTGSAGGTTGSAGGTTGSDTSGGSTGAGGAGGAAPEALWSMGYYASWQADTYPVDEIEWSGLTEIAMAFYMPNADGSLDLLGGNPEVATDLVLRAHDASVSALASIGGADSGEAFRQATSSDTMDAFVSNLVDLVELVGYDGVDIDWEPLETTDEALVVDLAKKLRAARPTLLLTAPIGYVNPNVAPDLSGYAALAEVYDQLNIMSYGMAGAWPGWNSWHSSALYQEDSATPLSVDSSVGSYLAAGVPAAKLGVGIGFYGLCYSEPVTRPDQALDGATVLASDGTMSFFNIMTRYYDESRREWDPLARVPYLSFDSPMAPDNCTYISYDDEQSIQEKGAYVKSSGLGGVIEWEINEGYLPDAPAGEMNPLLRAVREHVLD